MAITDILKTGDAGQQPDGITCPRFDAPPGEKRCRHYLKGGACALPDEFMCVEWLKANGHAVPPAAPAASETEQVESTAQPAAKAATDLFGNALPDPRPATSPNPARSPAPVRTHPAVEEADERPATRGLTTEDIESFKALGVEVCLRSEAVGDVWLVPEYTGRDRKEITPEHAATLCRVVEAFPGSQVVSFEKPPENDKQADKETEA